MGPREELFDTLAQQHWAISDHLIDPSLHERLYLQSQQAWQDGQFQPARIGHQYSPSAGADIRGDSICWLEHGSAGSAGQTFLAWAQTLQQDLNRVFYAGLKRAEFHFARYGSGQGYQKHMDQHRNNPYRSLSLVLYLNRTWTPTDGGELCLYDLEDPSVQLTRILPQPGRLVLFRSDMFPHEVLPCAQTRWSLTGWFRTDQHL